MQIPINYVNGIVVLPGFQILATRYALEYVFMDNYEVTFQCTVDNNEDALLNLMDKIYEITGLDLGFPPSSDKIRVLKFGTFQGPYSKSTVTVYFLEIIHTITFKVKRDYEIRTLSPEKAFNETLYSLTSGYSDTYPKYTGIAKCALQRINSHGGIMKCIKDSL